MTLRTVAATTLLTLACVGSAHAACPAGSTTYDVTDPTFAGGADPAPGNDDAAALLAALAAAKADQGAACVYLPPGDYGTTRSLSTGNGMAGGLAIAGASPMTTELVALADVPVITTGSWHNAQPGDRLTVRDLTMRGAPGGRADVVFVYERLRAGEPAYVADPLGGEVPDSFEACVDLDADLVRLPVDIEQVRVRNTGGKAIHIGSHVDARLTDVVVEDVDASQFGLYVSGRRVAIEVRGFSDMVGPGANDWVGSNYGLFVSNGRGRACMRVSDLFVDQGLLLAIGQASAFEMSHSMTLAAPFYVHLRDSRGRFTDSMLGTGAGGPYTAGLLYYPRDVEFDRVFFWGMPSSVSALHILWSVGPMVGGQRVSLIDTFFEGTGQQAVFSQAHDPTRYDNRLDINGGSVGPGYIHSLSQIGGATDAVCWMVDPTTSMDLGQRAWAPCEIGLHGTPFVDAGGTCAPVVTEGCP